MKRLQILRPLYLDDYLQKQKITLLKQFNKIKKDKVFFGYSVEQSAVYSSMIEGNKLDFDSYLKIAYSGMDKKNKSFVEIEDLKKAYLFAQGNSINLKNLLTIHKIASKNVIENKLYVGKIRDKQVFIFANGQKIYTGANPEIVKTETEKLLSDIAILIDRDLTISEVFYYAAYIHLIFAHIHPFADGNGRTARLLEKWFIASKLGQNAWNISTEKMYQKNLKKYYDRINLGQNYDTLNYNIALPFLLMLPISLRTK